MLLGPRGVRLQPRTRICSTGGLILPQGPHTHVLGPGPRPDTEGAGEGAVSYLNGSGWRLGDDSLRSSCRSWEHLAGFRGPSVCCRAGGPGAGSGVQTEAATEMTQRHKEWSKPTTAVGCTETASCHLPPLRPTGPDGSHFSPHTPRLSQPPPHPEARGPEGEEGHGHLPSARGNGPGQTNVRTAHSRARWAQSVPLWSQILRILGRAAEASAGPLKGASPRHRHAASRRRRGSN